MLVQPAQKQDFDGGFVVRRIGHRPSRSRIPSLPRSQMDPAAQLWAGLRKAHSTRVCSSQAGSEENAGRDKELREVPVPRQHLFPPQIPFCLPFAVLTYSGWQEIQT